MLNEFKEVQMTPALEMLMNSRKVKTEQEVEEDFKNRSRIAPSGAGIGKKKNNQIADLLEEEDMSDAFKD